MPACTWAMAFGAQTLTVWLLTRPLARAAGVADPDPSPVVLLVAFASLAILWSIIATTLKRLTDKALSRWHLLWIAALWLLSAFLGGRGDPVALALAALNLLSLLWLAWPSGWRLRRRSPA